MVAKDVKIINEQGLHMRPAGEFAREMTKFHADVTLVYNGKRVNAKSIMGMMSLGLGNGETLNVSADGSDEDAAIEGIEAFLSGKGE